MLLSFSQMPALLLKCMKLPTACLIFTFFLSLISPSAFQCTQFCLRCTLIGMYTLLLEFCLFMFWRENTLRGNFLLTQSLVWDAKIFHVVCKYRKNIVIKNWGRFSIPCDLTCKINKTGFSSYWNIFKWNKMCSATLLKYSTLWLIVQRCI